MNLDVERLVLALRSARKMSDTDRRLRARDPVSDALEAFASLRHHECTRDLVTLAWRGGEQEILAARFAMSGLGERAHQGLKRTGQEVSSPRQAVTWVRLALATSTTSLHQLALRAFGPEMMAQAAARDLPERVGYVPLPHLQPSPRYGSIAWSIASALTTTLTARDTTLLKGLCRVLAHSQDARAVEPLLRLANKPEVARDAVEALCDIPAVEAIHRLSEVIPLAHVRPAWVRAGLRHRMPEARTRIERAASEPSDPLRDSMLSIVVDVLREGGR